MQRAAAGVASLALRRLAAAASRPALLADVAPLRPAASTVAAARFLLEPTTAAALYARRGYAACAGGDRKARAVSVEDLDDDNQYSTGDELEFYCDSDDDGLEGLTDDDDEIGGSDDGDCEPVPERGRR